MSSPVTEVEPPSLQEASPPGTDLAPVGVQRERVDPYTLLVMGKLFPAPTSGLEFLALLLRWAIVKQLSHGLGDSDHAAVITVQSIRQLATLIGWSYETTHKYVVLFCALGLLTKRRVNGKVELSFALGRYEPPLTLDALDALIEKYRHRKRGGKTDKRLKHAERVKRRFLLLYGDRQRAELPSHSPEACNPVAADLQDAIGEVQLLLKVETSEVTRERLAVLLTKLERVQGRFADMQVDGRYHLLPAGPPTSDKGEQEQSEESTQGDDPGRREVVVSASNLPKLPYQVDSSSPTATRKGRFVAHKVDSLIHEPDAQGRLSHAKVDSLDSERPNEDGAHEGKSTLSPRTNTQIGRLSPQKIGTSAKKVDSGAPETPNVNVVIHTVIDSLNVNVRGVIEYLRNDLFKEPLQKRGYYYNLYNKQQCRNAEVWLAATIETLIGMYQAGTVKFPGKYFYDRCVALHQGGIPPETAALVQRYGHLSYAQLLQVLTSSPPPVPSQTMTFRPPAPRRQAIHLRIERAKHLSGMNRDDLKRLLQLIGRDERTCGLFVQPYLQSDGSCALLIDDGMGHQRWVYEPFEWQERLVCMQTTLDLFSREQKMIHSTSGMYHEKNGREA